MIGKFKKMATSVKTGGKTKEAKNKTTIEMRTVL